jgi:hypothetical protein
MSAGEAAQGPNAAAIANAVFDALGCACATCRSRPSASSPPQIDFSRSGI